MILPGNEEIGHRESSLTVRFNGPRNVISTSWMNGGYRKDLEAVFNHQISPEACEACHANGGVRTYLEGVAGLLSLNPARTTGLLTRAEMKNAAVVSESFRDLTVTAVVTAGIDKNGGRAGDPASYYENGDSFEPVGGTINTILIINADLPEFAMTRAVMTATEAKAAALQQLMARSICSTGIATGSGTDMIALVANPGSPLRLTDAGKHAKLGELIGKTVIAATQAALERETGLSPTSQRDVLVRLSRFGVTVDDIWDSATVRYGEMIPKTLSKEKFVHCFREKSRDANLVTLVSAVLHILDEATWNLLPEDEAKNTACRLIRHFFDPKLMISDDNRSKPAQEEILSCLVGALADMVLCEINDGIPFPAEAG